MTQEQIKNRIANVEAMLEARTDSEGKPHVGFKDNVAAIQSELARLRGLQS